MFCNRAACCDSGDEKRIKKAIKKASNSGRRNKRQLQRSGSRRSRPYNEELMGRNVWWLKKATTSERRECHPTWHVTPNSCVFASVETAIMPGIAVHQSQVEVQDGARTMGNHLEIHSDALTFPIEESVHNGYLEFKNVDFACPTVVKGRLREIFHFGRTLGLAGGCCVSFKKAIA